MDDGRKAKIGRYLRNARNFLWGLPWDRPRDPSRPQNQEQIYEWLKHKGFKFNDKSPYRNVTSDLLQEYGIERILKDLIIPQVEKIYGSKAIDFLRDCWNMGMLPSWSSLTTLNIWKLYPFLEGNEQYKYIAGWGEFAGVWFEEIEERKEQ